MSKAKNQREVIIQRTKGRSDPPQEKVSPLHRYALEFSICLFLIAAILAVFWQVRTHEFLKYDDEAYVTVNPHVNAGLTLKGIIWAFTTTHASNWHPLTWLSHMLDCQLYGLNPAGHHLTNLVFHIASTLLLFLVLKGMTGALWRSGFVAALFALHPLHVESVAWVAERKDVLSTFFWILTMWAYVRYTKQPRLNRYMVVLLSFGLGLMSKPMLVTLPFVLLLVDYWPLGRFQFVPLTSHRRLNTDKSKETGDQRSLALRLVLEKVPFFALAAVSSFLTFFAQRSGGAVRSLEWVPLETRVANALVSYVSYIGKMIWPHRLAVLYPYSHTLPIWQVAGAGLLLGVVSFLVILGARRRPYLMMGWLWYLGTLVPVIGLLQVGQQAMADRYTYVPLIGLFVMIAWGIPDILAGWRFRKIVLSLSTGLLLLLLMTVTNFQLKYWRNDITLFEHTLAVTSDNFTINYYLGVFLAEHGKTQEAIAHFAEALRIRPDFAKADYNLGGLLANQGKTQEAIAHFAEALRIKPDFAEAHYNLGIILWNQGKIQEAIAHCVEALRINPDYAEAHYGLGEFLANQGKTQEAIAHFAEALRIRPDFAEAHSNLGIILGSQGKIQEAIAHFAEALRIKPDIAEAHSNLGIILTSQGRIQDAIAHFAEAVRLKPDYAMAHVNLGFAYLMIGDKNSALEEYKILKKISPGLANILYCKIFK